MCRLACLAALALCLTTLVSNQLNARDDGRFANSPLKPWFDRLASGNGLCCSFADGFSVQDVDWNTQEGHYRVNAKLVACRTSRQRTSRQRERHHPHHAGRNSDRY
jgi:hypothetical protein